MSYDDQYLFTVGEDGCLFLLKAVDKEGRGLKRDKEFGYAEEILITKSDLEEKVLPLHALRSVPGSQMVEWKKIEPGETGETGGERGGIGEEGRVSPGSLFIAAFSFLSPTIWEPGTSLRSKRFASIIAGIRWVFETG